MATTETRKTNNALKQNTNRVNVRLHQSLVEEFTAMAEAAGMESSSMFRFLVKCSLKFATADELHQTDGRPSGSQQYPLRMDDATFKKIEELSTKLNIDKPDLIRKLIVFGLENIEKYTFGELIQK